MDPRQDYIQTRHFRSAPHNLSLPVAVEHEVTTSSAGPAGFIFVGVSVLNLFKYKDLQLRFKHMKRLSARIQEKRYL